jgi:hypothetical protein
MQLSASALPGFVALIQMPSKLGPQRFNQHAGG